MVRLFGNMKDIILFHHFTLLILICICISHSLSKDGDVPRQNLPVKDIFGHGNYHELSDKEKGSVENHMSELLQTSGSGNQETSDENIFRKDEDKIQESLDHSTSSGDGSSLSGTDHSGYVEQKNKDSTTNENSVIDEISGAGSGYENKTKSAENMFKGLIEDEEIETGITRLEQKSLNVTGKEDDSNFSPTTANLPKIVTETRKANSTPGYSEEMRTDITTPEGVKDKKNSTFVVQKPTSFLSALREIKYQLNELLKWKREHRRKLHKVAMAVSETFKKEKVFMRSQADKKHYREPRRTKRSYNEKENTLSKEILKKIEDNFPCRHPETMERIKSGSSFFNKRDCSQCKCHMAKLSCVKDLEKCYPNACHLLNGDVVPNLAIHNDGCNNCLCHSGQLVCTHLRCPEAGHHYTSYKDIGLRNAEPENFSKNIVTEKPVRNPDACLECDHLPGPYVCGRKQWKTFPSLCHAIFCGKNQDNDIKERSCETLDPCSSSPCGKDQQCVAHYQTPCIAGEKTTTFCQQYKCLSKNLECSKQPADLVCGADDKSYSNECEMFSKGVQLAYKGPCKKNCNSEVCGIESRTFASYCQSAGMKGYVDYRGPCEYHFTAPLIQETKTGETFFKNERCDLVYEHGRCAPAKCDEAVLPLGACCPVCGAAFVLSLNLNRLNEDIVPARLDQIHGFVINLQEEVSPKLCKLSIDLTYSMDILIVLLPYRTNELEACRTMASEMVDKINYARDEKETGIQSIFGAATLIEGKPFERIDDSEV